MTRTGIEQRPTHGNHSRKLKLRTLFFFLAGVLFPTSNTFGSEADFQLPPLAHPGEGAYIMSELIYRLQDKPTPQCHASTIVETATGLVAAWFGGTRERHPDVGIWVSRHNGESWSKPVEVANDAQPAFSRRSKHVERRNLERRFELEARSDARAFARRVLVPRRHSDLRSKSSHHVHLPATIRETRRVGPK